tara:strand:- start:3554 stop:4126 length:573 start_codon:yes stop_codon:yes gene_type:complete
MSEETQVATKTASEGTTQESTTNTPDVGSLIAESKKYRQRSQDAEAQLAKLQSKLETQENVKLKEKEEFKTLAEKFESQVNELSPYKQKYEAMVDAKRQSLLNKIPEDKRDTFKSKDLDVLEFMVDNLSPKDNLQPSARGSVPKNQEFGGYESKLDWVSKDPEGYEKAKQKEKGGIFGDIFAPKQNPFSG